MFIQGQLYDEQAQSSKLEDDYKNAEKYMQEALRIIDNPLDAEYLKLAGVYSSQKKYKEAINMIQIAIKENPKNDFAHFRLVIIKEVYYEDIDAKIKAYEDYIRKFPKSNLLGFAQSKLSRLKEQKFLKTED